MESGYLSWPLLPELFPVSFPGVKTSRDDIVVDIDKDRLVSRVKQYFDPELGDAEIRAMMPSAMTSTAGFDAKKARRFLLQRGFKQENIVRYCYRPFDNRWLYWEPETTLLDRKREEYFPQVFEGNIWIEARQKQPMEHFDRGYVVRVLADNFGNGLSNFFPLYLKSPATPGTLFAKPTVHAHWTQNVSKPLETYLKNLGTEITDFFLHCVAVLRTPSYGKENAGALRMDWPRIPAPASKEALMRSAQLGHVLADLLDVDIPVRAITGGKARSELNAIATICREAGGSLNPDAGDLNLTAGWGHGVKGGAVMPGKGKIIDRDYTLNEREAVATGAAHLGLSTEQALNQLGERTCDVYLNNVAYWRNVPSRVWEYTIGGYQVIKKWLSYRERDILGRGFTMEEARTDTDIARRIAAILLMEPALDVNYETVKKATYHWTALSREDGSAISRFDPKLSPAS